MRCQPALKPAACNLTPAQHCFLLYILLQPDDYPLTFVEICRVTHSCWIAAATSVDSANSSSGNCSVTLLKQLLSTQATVSSTSQYLSQPDPRGASLPRCAIELNSLRGVARCCSLRCSQSVDSSETRLCVYTPEGALSFERRAILAFNTA